MEACSEDLFKSHNKITDILQERETNRLKSIQKRRKEKDLLNVEHEQVAHFNASFEEKKTEIETALAFTEKVKSYDLPNHFDNICKQIQLLQKYVSASTLFLRGYDIRKSQQVLQELANLAHEKEEIYLPKKKFGFKNKKLLQKDVVDNTFSNSDSTIDVINSTKKKVILDLDKHFCGFESKSNEKLILHNDSIFKKDVILHTLTNCIVMLFGSPSTLHLNHLNNCIVLCGPVSTSVFADNCNNCKFVFACQQLRLHSSKFCDIYLHVTSRAIMEDCTEIRIAPYNLKYESMKDHFINSGLDISTNNWASVDDFNWLASDKHSPNWKILEEKCRISDWDSVNTNVENF